MNTVITYLMIILMPALINVLDTIRLLSITRGKKIQAGLIGGLQSIIYVLIFSDIIDGPLNGWKVISYGVGVAIGIYIGMLLEQHITVGYQMLQIFSRHHGVKIAGQLHENGHAATLSPAIGMCGDVHIINCAVDRKDIPHIKNLIETTDPSAFVTSEAITPLRRGYFRPRARRPRGVAI